MAAENEGIVQSVDELDVYVIPVGDSSREKVLGIVEVLRKAGLSVDFDLMRRSLSKNLKYASSAKAKKVIIASEKSLAKGMVTIRNMASGEQRETDTQSLAIQIMNWDLKSKERNILDGVRLKPEK
jgi:histidyl-tRNA synthetase